MPPCCFRLEVTRGPHAGLAHRYCWQEQPERPSSLSIGRRKRCWLRLPQDLEVSSLHAELHVLEGGSGLAVRDAKSTNGSKLNGQPLQPQQNYPLCDGDLIGVGRTSVRFVEVVHGQPCGKVDAAVARAEAAVLTPIAPPAAPEVIVLDDESAEEREESGSASVEAGSSAAGSSETPADQPDTEPAHDEVVFKPVSIVVNAGKNKREKERGSEADVSLAQKEGDGKASGSRTGCVNEFTPEEATCTKCGVVIGQLDLLEQQAHLNECLGGRVAAASTASSTATTPAVAAATAEDDKQKTRKRANAGGGGTRVKKPRKPKAGGDGDGTAAAAPKAKKPRKRKRADAGEDIELALMMAGSSKLDKEQQTDAKLAVARKKLEQLDVQMAKLTKRRANLVKTLDRLERAKEKLRKSQVLPPAKVRELLDLKAALDAIFPTSRQASPRSRESTREADTFSVVAQRYAPSRGSELGNDIDCDEEKRAELAAVAAISMWARASQQLFGLSRDTLLYRTSVLRRFLGDEDNADGGNMELLNDAGDDEDTADDGVDIDRDSEAERELVPTPDPRIDSSSERAPGQPEVPDVVKRVFPNWQRDLAFLQGQTAEELEMALEALKEAHAEADAEAVGGGARVESKEECSAGGSHKPSAQEEQRLACEYMAQVMKQLIVDKRPRIEEAGVEYLDQQQQLPVIDLVAPSGECVPRPEEHESIAGASANEAEEEPYSPAPEVLPKAAGSQTAIPIQAASIAKTEPEQSFMEQQELGGQQENNV
jgi:hypothetical protein